MRTARTRRYVMCRPEHFEVVYAINPWMDPTSGADRARALTQWESIGAAYRALGHSVSEVPAGPGLPDMVFAANSGLAISGRVLAARMAHPERAGEEARYRAWFAAAGLEVVEPVAVNEGEGDFVVAGAQGAEVVLAGYGFRADSASFGEIERAFDREVVPVRLVDPRYYHLDTVVGVLDETTVAAYLGGLEPAAVRALEARFEVVAVDEADAAVFGCNFVSDGRSVVVERAATGLHRRLTAAGFDVVPVDTSELRKAGGSVKCCTLELHGAVTIPAQAAYSQDTVSA